MARIFISYRQKDGAEIATRIAEYLKFYLPSRSFFDKKWFFREFRGGL
jgi:hypothetical protein